MHFSDNCSTMIYFKIHSFEYRATAVAFHLKICKIMCLCYPNVDLSREHNLVSPVNHMLSSTEAMNSCLLPNVGISLLRFISIKHLSDFFFFRCCFLVCSISTCPQYSNLLLSNKIPYYHNNHSRYFYVGPIAQVLVPY